MNRKSKLKTQSSRPASRSRSNLGGRHRDLSKDKVRALRIHDTKARIVLVADKPQISYTIAMALKMNGYENNVSILTHQQLSSDSADVVWERRPDNDSNPTKLLFLIDSGEMDVDQWHNSLYRQILTKKSKHGDKNRIRICFLARDKSELARIQSTLRELANLSLPHSLPCDVIERPFTVTEVGDMVTAQLLLLQSNDGSN